jgi:hypothetical protein
MQTQICISSGWFRNLAPAKVPQVDLGESSDYVKAAAVKDVLVAQLDRALASEAKGRWFESSQARHVLK